MRTNFRWLHGASQSKGSLQLRRTSIRRWLRERRAKLMQSLMPRVDGQGCQTTPPLTQSVRMLRPHQLPQTWIDLIQPMMLFVTWPMACTTLTSDGIPEESPVKMRQVFCWLMATRSCRSWCIFRELGRWGGWPSHWKVLSSKSIGFWKDIVSKSWLLTCIQRLTTKRSFKQPLISHGSWLNTLPILLRGSCEVFWAMTLRSCVIKTLNSSWHRSFGFCRCIGNS